MSVYWFNDGVVMQNRELQIMRKLDHDNIVRLRYFFYSSGDKVINTLQTVDYVVVNLDYYLLSIMYSTINSKNMSDFLHFIFRYLLISNEQNL